MGRTLLDERYEGFWGGSRLLLDIYNPLNKPRIITEGPDQVDLFGLAYTSAIVYGGIKLASLITGEKILFTEYLMHRGDMVRRGVITAGRGVVSAAPPLIIGGTAIAASTAGAVLYEKHVNERVRKSSRGTSGLWFGPYASGFGSVVN
jgi:hypothetical protein